MASSWLCCPFCDGVGHTDPLTDPKHCDFCDGRGGWLSTDLTTPPLLPEAADGK